MALPEAVRLRREPTVAGFEEQRHALKQSGHASLERVAALSHEQLDLGQTLAHDLAALVSQYEVVQTALRRATALADDLHVCAVELQLAVDRLHESRAEALADGKLVAQRVLALEEALQAGSDDRVRDRATFELRQETTRLALLEGMAGLCADQLGPARQLRDTVQMLHAETARYVLNAAGTINEAGRSIHALGVAADAPVVVSELKRALEQLESSMSGTAGVIELASHLVTDVLPDLDAQLSAVDETRRVVADGQHGMLDRAASRARAERALRLAAEAEVEALGR